ncbi:MAG: HDOD domain-containing protein [Pseudomonadota bacterium]
MSGVDKQINKFFTELVSTLVSVIEQKDPYMRGHAERVAGTCAAFSRTLKLSQQAETDKIYFAGLLYDVGMVYIPKEITQSPGSLTEDEMAIVRQHPVIAENILANLTILRGILPMIRHHHEAFDGSGYPDGIKGHAIPLGARIIGIVDSFDAMTSDRPHRKALSSEEAIAALNDQAGKQYDRMLLNQFVRFLQLEESSERSRPAEGDDTLAVREILEGVVEKMKSGKIDLPVLPRIVQDVEEVLKNPHSTGEDLAKVIECDAVISIRLISVANSPYYRGLEQITSVRTAISRLGHSETQNLVAAIANKSLFETNHVRFKQLMENLWLHSLACGYAAAGIAKRLELKDVETFFFVGLSHDIGKVVLLKSLSDEMPKRPSVKTDEIQGDIDIYHTSVSRLMLRRWNYPPEILRAVTKQEQIDMPEDADQMLLVLRLANRIVEAAGFTIFGNEHIEDIADNDALVRLAITGEDAAAIGEEVKVVMTGASKHF